MKRCRTCKQPFEPFNTLQVCCSAKCSIEWAKLTPAEKQAKHRRRLVVAEKRERRAALKSRKDWLKDAQAVFNAMIRERDHFKPCISCGDTKGPFDCGHYRGVGAYPELRFEPMNAAKQCRYKCNRGGGYIRNEKLRERVTAAFRVGLIERIGLRQVEWLESYHEPLRPSVEWLQEKIREWRLETRRMRDARERRAVA